MINSFYFILFYLFIYFLYIARIPYYRKASLSVVSFFLTELISNYWIVCLYSDGNLSKYPAAHSLFPILKLGHEHYTT
ncbi:hypothetical protein BDV36DRAFT_191181 [Aspergillus pseudocaelatus]|uniref:Uncharacterized protein n=1 Tax=Aspergillus pseudocaelatus TaxID=1825620 RepID=A0ABQ6WIE0_9EURO|nr:hypothetical protein BDV36DRAFT_191181 [Aspergillus pseudocaelatus]